jgi:hypothetical protein
MHLATYIEIHLPDRIILLEDHIVVEDSSLLDTHIAPAKKEHETDKHHECYPRPAYSPQTRVGYLHDLSPFV